MEGMENNINGGVPEDTSGAGGAQETSTDLWDDFFDDPDLEPGSAQEPEGGETETVGAEGGDPASVRSAEPTAGQQRQSRYTSEGGSAGGQEGHLPDVDAIVQQRVDAAIARQFGGMVNPYTGRPITTEAELAAYQQAFAAEEQERRLRESGIDRNILNEAISGHPVVQQANAMLHEQQQRQANDFMSQEFAALLQEFPDCGLKDARDLMDTPEGRETLNLWRSGPISLKTAYAATHLKEIQARQSKAVRQGVMNEVNGRAHLTQTNRGGQATGEMPAEVNEAYKIYGVGKDDAERLKIWKRVHAGG